MRRAQVAAGSEAGASHQAVLIKIRDPSLWQADLVKIVYLAASLLSTQLVSGTYGKVVQGTLVRSLQQVEPRNIFARSIQVER